MGSKKRGRKQPGIAQAPTLRKRPGIERPPELTAKTKPAWILGIFDGDGGWAGGMASLAVSWQDVRDKLKSYESMTWGQIEANKTHNHPVEVADLTKQARDRLAELNLDDVDSLFRFRFNGKQRLWGIRDGATFKILWWDPEHQVCPSQKKHT